MQKSQGGVIYLPEGEYLISNQIKLRLEKYTGLAIRGDGPRLSIIRWLGEEGGIFIEAFNEGGFDGDKAFIVIENLNLIANQNYRDPAIHILINGEPASPSPDHYELTLNSSGKYYKSRSTVVIDNTNLSIQESLVALMKYIN